MTDTVARLWRERRDAASLRQLFKRVVRSRTRFVFPHVPVWMRRQAPRRTLNLERRQCLAGELVVHHCSHPLPAKII